MEKLPRMENPLERYNPFNLADQAITEFKLRFIEVATCVSAVAILWEAYRVKPTKVGLHSVITGALVLTHDAVKAGIEADNVEGTKGNLKESKKHASNLADMTLQQGKQLVQQRTVIADLKSIGDEAIAQRTVEKEAAEAQIERLQGEVGNLQGEVGNLKGEVGNLKGVRDDLETHVQQLKRIGASVESSAKSLERRASSVDVSDSLRD